MDLDLSFFIKCLHFLTNQGCEYPSEGSRASRVLDPFGRIITYRHDDARKSYAFVGVAELELTHLGSKGMAHTKETPNLP